MRTKPLILIADDDYRNIFALKAVLQIRGYQVITAADGRECITVLQGRDDVDIVLMDMMMPEMDGYEAIGELRTLSQFRELPIIAVTAQAMTGDKERCLAAGATDYLAKPIDDEKLMLLLNQYLNN